MQETKKKQLRRRTVHSCAAESPDYLPTKCAIFAHFVERGWPCWAVMKYKLSSPELNSEIKMSEYEKNTWSIFSISRSCRCPHQTETWLCLWCLCRDAFTFNHSSLNLTVPPLWQAFNKLWTEIGTPTASVLSWLRVNRVCRPHLEGDITEMLQLSELREAGKDGKKEEGVWISSSIESGLAQTDHCKKTERNRVRRTMIERWMEGMN